MEPVQVAIHRLIMVDLPCGATEDRVCERIDINETLAEDVKAFCLWCHLVTGNSLLTIQQLSCVSSS